MIAREEYLIPKIAAKDYDAFRRIINADFPYTYDEWLKLMAERRLEHERRQFIAREIEVNPDEFTRYCRAKGSSYNLKTLEDFTAEIATGNRY